MPNTDKDREIPASLNATEREAIKKANEKRSEPEGARRDREASEQMVNEGGPNQTPVKPLG